MARVWLITGSSSGFGRAVATAAARIGDTVIAATRSPEKLEDLKKEGNIVPQALNVCGSDEEVKSTVSGILSRFGHIDILVNNAGYILEGAIEECSQMRLLRAVLPSMRARRLGLVANMGSIGGWSGTPAAGLYCASKAAVAIYSESLRGELVPFGIQVVCIEPGYFRTNFLSGDHKIGVQKPLPELEPATSGTQSALAAYNQHQPGDPAKGAAIIVEALTGTGRCQGRELPPRLALGRDAIAATGSALDQNRDGLEKWKDVVTATDCEDVQA